MNLAKPSLLHFKMHSNVSRMFNSLGITGKINQLSHVQINSNNSNAMSTLIFIKKLNKIACANFSFYFQREHLVYNI